MGNQPLTYIRQLLTVCLNPLKYLELDQPEVVGAGERWLGSGGELVEDIPSDVKERAKILLKDIQGQSLGTCTCTCIMWLSNVVI